MLKYHLISFFRNLKRNRLFTIINILGLSFGIGSALLIYLYVSHELSFDTFHTKADKIYRVNQPYIWSEQDDYLFSSTGPGVAYAIDQEIPEVKQVTRLHTTNNFLVQHEQEDGSVIAFDEANVLAADTNFLNFFTFPLVGGNPKEVLKPANSVILTQATAKRYFGEQRAIGKTLLFSQDGQRTSYIVTGVIEDIPSNSYISFDMLLSMSSFPNVEKRNWSWVWTTFVTFVELREDASPTVVQSKLTSLASKYARRSLEVLKGITFEEYQAQGKSWKLHLQPLTAIRLGSNKIYNRLNDVGNYKIVYALLGAAFFIILLSCINFMNLSTAQFTKQAKATGIHKVLGSSRKQLAFKYLTESVVFSLISLVVALMLTQLSLPAFNQLVNKTLQFSALFTAEMALKLLAFALTIGILSGLYPALFLSGFSPIASLKGKLKSGKHGKVFRNSLVVLQFVFSTILIISTLVVYKQLSFVNARDMGYDRENLLVVERLNTLTNPTVFADKAKQLTNISSLSVCYGVPPRVWNGDSFKAVSGTEQTISLNYVQGDAQYLPTLNAPLVLGRNFTEVSADEQNNVILNETAVKQFGWSVDESVLGKEILYGNAQKFTIIGVVKDYRFWSLQSSIESLGIFYDLSKVDFNASRTALIKAKVENSEELTTLLATLEKEWETLTSDIPFQYSFVDEVLAADLASDTMFRKTLTVFAVLALLIASLGLLGMVIYALEQKVKEIGIRKVLGSSVARVLVLLYKEYAKLLGIASIISIPISVYLMQNWLQDFEYRITLSVDIFVVSVVVTSSFALLITGYHSIKAALTNPVNVLRNE